jgi:ABC-type transport system involved in multi-copper enzyme maturation permease subunit
VSRLLAVAHNAFRETVRERVLYNLVFFALIMTLSGLLLGQLSIRQDEKIIKDIGLAAMELFGSLIAIFVGVGLVSKEIERRSLYPLLAKPVTREQFLAGKFLGLVFTLFVNVVVMSAGLYLTLLATSGTFDPRLLKAIFPIFLALVLTVAIAVLLSAVTSSALAAVGSVTLVLVGRYLDVLKHIDQVAPGAPSGLLRALYAALPNFQYFDFKNRVVYGDPVPAADLLWVTGYGLVYTGVLLGIALAVFRRRDFV